MKIKKTLLTIALITLLLSLSISSPTLARPTNQLNTQFEERAVEQLMDAIEDAAEKATSFENFLELIRDLLNRDNFKAFPLIRDIIERILNVSQSKTGFSIRGHSMSSIGDRGILPLRIKKHFVISYGVYNRLNPFKDNQIKIQKEGLTFWRYGGTSSLMRGRTLIIERQPFGIKQRIIGPQCGLMAGFRGIYFDMESRLTGNAYSFFMGGTQRIRGFDLSPFAD
jgi:hypothetical protein